MTEPVNYAGAGVDYDAMDPFKLACQHAARNTGGNTEYLGYYDVPSSRGESVQVLDGPDSYLAHVVEGLGTKALVADAVAPLTGRSHYDAIAHDTVATIINDLLTLGALPLATAMFLAVSDSSWFADTQRAADLAEGWARACHVSGCVWTGGETQTLPGVIMPGTVLLGGSATGIVRPRSNIIHGNIAPGDTIVLLASSGIHANGLTLVRQIADRTGYDARLADGRMLGEALLDPSVIYAPVMRSLLDDGLPIHYAVHITGHGWRKLMRAVEPFVYIIDEVPEPPPVFDFLGTNGPVSLEDLYGTFNMGAGFALIVHRDDARRVVQIAAGHGIEAWVAGRVERRGGDKAVEIRPLDIRYEGASLTVR
jgi:phosphoribosylformylglycinamidine cyclo-ligase